MTYSLQRNELDKIQDALMSRDEIACKMAMSFLTNVKERMADSDLREQAHDLYGTDEVEIDDEAATSEADNGTWVQAWVWVSNEEREEKIDPRQNSLEACKLREEALL